MAVAIPAKPTARPSRAASVPWRRCCSAPTMTVGIVATSAIPWASTWLVPSAKTITAIAIAPPPTPSSPARNPPLSPSASSSRIVGTSSSSVSLPAPKPNGITSRRPNTPVRTANAIRSPRSEMRALTRAPSTAPPRLPTTKTALASGSNAPPGATA